MLNNVTTTEKYRKRSRKYFITASSTRKYNLNNYHCWRKSKILNNVAITEKYHKGCSKWLIMSLPIENTNSINKIKFNNTNADNYYTGSRKSLIILLPWRNIPKEAEND